MQENGSRKRKLLFDDLTDNEKKFKVLNYSEDEDSEHELQIDINPNLNQENMNEIDENFLVSWTRPSYSDCVNVTLSSGHRCYVKVNNEINDFSNSTMNVSFKVASQSFYSILDEANELFKKRERKSIQHSENISASSKTLWVTKYAPRKYVDLLSSESANRSLLSWLKSWDKHVFNRNTKFTDKLIYNFNTGNKGTNFEEVLQINPKDQMPVKKVVLLSGPPGLGKTTLAQIVARSVGYYPVEINASDDRSPEVFKNRIEALNDTQLGISNDSGNEQLMKPCCLILDEIDGTGVAAVNILVNAILASNKTENSTKTVGKKKEKSPLKINRPIICICNDLYAQSLRQLRPLCYVIKIIPPDYNQLMRRLSEIGKLENLEFDHNLLRNVIDMSNRDIRSCLNTLQFIEHKDPNDFVATNLVSNINIGQKDVDIGIFKIWQDIFTEPNLKRSYLATTGKNSNELATRNKNILALARSAGDLDKIISGIHENYLSIVRFKDFFLQGMVDAADWMVFNDMTNVYINSKQAFEMFRYKENIISFFHLSFASTAILPSSIRYPTSDTNAYFSHQKMKSICDSFVTNQGSISQWIQSRQEVVQLMLPYLVNIIRPNELRPINTQLYSSKEKIILQNTVNIMISTGLGYTQDRLGEMQYQYVLNPNIEEISKFNLNEMSKKELTYSTKQLIANEIIRERIKRADINRYKKSNENSNELNEFSQNRIGFIMQKAEEYKNKSTINCVAKYKDAYNFRLGPKKGNSTKDENLNPVLSILNQPVWFKFKEGYCNAIRRPVKMKDL